MGPGCISQTLVAKNKIKIEKQKKKKKLKEKEKEKVEKNLYGFI